MFTIFGNQITYLWDFRQMLSNDITTVVIHNIYDKKKKKYWIEIKMLNRY